MASRFSAGQGSERGERRVRVGAKPRISSTWAIQPGFGTKPW
jgi:hypothetical protein